MFWDFPGAPVIGTLPFKAGGASLILGQVFTFCHPICLMAKNQSRQQKQYCNKFNKDFLKIICVHLGRGKEACFEGCTCINGLGPSMADDATTLLA